MNTKNGPAVYCQLMRTEYRDGKARQKVVLSLGRTEKVDLPALERLVERVNQGRSGALEPSLEPLFPGVREYGPSALLLHALDVTGLERLWAGAARARKAPLRWVDALRALSGDSPDSAITTAQEIVGLYRQRARELCQACYQVTGQMPDFEAALSQGEPVG